MYLKVVGLGSYSASCAVGTGAYSIPNVTFSGDASLTLYLKSAGTKGAVVTRTPNTDITDLDIYEHRVIVRHEDIDPLSIENMSYFDNDDDTDMPFTATTTGTDTLTLEADTKLFIWNSKEFRPSGNIE